MSDDINSYEKAVLAAAQDWRKSILNVKDKREFKEAVAELEEAKENPKPTQEDKKKINALQAAVGKCVDTAKKKATEDLNRKLQQLKKKEGEDSERFNKVREEILDDADYKIKLTGTVTLSATLSYDTKSNKVDSGNVGIGWSF